MRFASVDSFIESTDVNFRVGRPVANESFLRALLTHGTYDAYEFFCPDHHTASQFVARLGELIPEQALLSRVRAHHHLALFDRMEDQFDVFHMGDFTSTLPFLASLRDRFRTPFPITGVTHSIDGTHMHTRFTQLALAGLKPFDAVVCTSRCAQEAVTRKLAEVSRLLGHERPSPVRTAQIPLGIDDELFEPDSRDQARSFLRVPPEATVALSVGRLSLRLKSDWAPILELLGRMRGQGKLRNFLLIIAGGADDSETRLLEQLIDSTGNAGQVAVFPNFPPHAKRMLYSSADFYLSLVDNFQETFGLNVAEAMACGLPIIASNFSGYRDNITDGVNGYLIPTYFSETLPPCLEFGRGVLTPSVERLVTAQGLAIDLERLGTSIEELCQRPDRRAEMGKMSRAMAERFRWRSIIQQYETLWSNLSEAAKASPLQPEFHASTIAGDRLDAYLHFPSHLVGENTLFRITDCGKTALSAPHTLTRYSDIVPMLDITTERHMLTALTIGPATLSRLREIGHRGTPTGVMDFHVLWLLKHGAIAVVH